MCNTTVIARLSSQLSLAINPKPVIAMPVQQILTKDQLAGFEDEKQRTSINPHQSLPDLAEGRFAGKFADQLQAGL
jgi:hypothetical protein